MSKKVLIVDDDPDVRLFNSTVVEENGFTPIEATNGEEGLAVVKKESPDLVLLDVLMPKQSGIRLYRHLKTDKSLIGIPVIMGILPLRTPRHAVFLHERVAGIAVPKALRDRMHGAEDPVAEGAANAREMVAVARDRFSGVCIMPPFDHYEVLLDILS